MSFFFAPERKSVSYALCNSLSVMKALKRETTMANRFPAALRLPSREGIAGSGGDSTFNLVFSVAPCLHGEFPAPEPYPTVRSRNIYFCNLTSDFLLAFKPRRPFLQKRRRPFFLIFSRATDAKQRSFKKQPLGQRHLHALVDGLHRILHGQRSIRHNLRRNRLRPRNQLGSRRHLIHETNAMRLLRHNHLARQHVLHSQPFA